MTDSFRVTFDLPATMSRDIGRLIVRYAYLEHYLQQTIYMVLGVEPGVGRIAVREQGRITDRLELLLDIVAAKYLRCPDDFDIKEIREAVGDITDMRNLCAHSVWTWNAEHQGWAIFVSRGHGLAFPSMKRAPEAKGSFPKGKSSSQTL